MREHKVAQQEEEGAKFYRLSVRLEAALARLTALREKLQHRMSELETSANRLRSELADESLAYLSAAHSIRPGDVRTLPDTAMPFSQLRSLLVWVALCRRRRESMSCCVTARTTC
ncbi:hypothetical protein PQR39_36355 [Paraburkholderia sediminicola]|uniref:hypothetical protein n=1 Tax=Paraburkholderia sediminicola TaxID=458836 RepID=UPI0038B8C615